MQNGKQKGMEVTVFKTDPRFLIFGRELVNKQGSSGTVPLGAKKQKSQIKL